MNVDDTRDDILNKLSIPHAYFPQETIEEKKKLAWHIFHSDNEAILLPTFFAFSYSAVIAGLSAKHIEFVAKNAPADYKKELLNAISQKYKLQEIIEIAKSMDEDMQSASVENQNRIKNVIRYIKDNREAFEF